MNAFLIQILSVGLTISQLFSKPVEQFKTHIDPQTEMQVAVQIMRDGCKIMTTQFQDARFDAEVLLGALKTDADNDRVAEQKNPSLAGSSDKLLKRVDFGGLLNAYRLFCKNDQSVAGKINMNEVLDYYNGVFKDLKDVNTLKNYKMPEATMVTDGKGQAFNEMYGSGNRRLVVPISKVPEHVKQAFISAEDQNFYKHKGVDLFGLFRAFSSLAGGGAGRPQGGSTITQQVVKNMLVNDDLTIERKMREMLLAARLERILTKDQILELYINHIFLGRSSWGVEMAAKSYFGPQATTATLTPDQAALLAALTKGPLYYNPDRQPERAKDRRQYVLNRMREDCETQKRPGCLSAQQVAEMGSKPFGTVRFESPSAKGGFYFLDAILKEAKAAHGMDLRNLSTHTVQATVNPVIQKATEQAVRDGLMAYEARTGRKVWTGPQGSLAADIEKHKMQWQQVLPRVQPLLYDVPWTLAVVLDLNRPQVGLPDGKVATLKAQPSVMRNLKKYDLVFVDVSTGGKDKGLIATVKLPTRVQGAAVVLENRTGRILAISGGFSYSGSEYNRAIVSKRQPGSTIKPFIYLTALNEGFQPNTLVPNTAPNLGKWRPKNYDGGQGGLVTYRSAIERSMNLPTVQTTVRLGEGRPLDGLHLVQATFRNLGLYKKEVQRDEYSEILGSREVRLIDLAVAYATVANSGLRPSPYFIDSISREGRVVYANPKAPLRQVQDIDRVSFYQLKRILEGTVARGTATRLKRYETFIAGKTGTSNDENDAWFVGYTNDITVAVWAGYDDRKVYRNLGGGSTGGRVALPIAEQIFEAAFTALGKPERLNGAPDEIKTQIVERGIDFRSGRVGAGNFTEIFRVDAGKRPYANDLMLANRDEQNIEVNQDSTESEPSSMNDQQTAEMRRQSEDQDVQVETVQAPAQRVAQPNSPPTYNPGANDNYEIWRKQPRKVDPTLQDELRRLNMIIVPQGGNQR